MCKCEQGCAEVDYCYEGECVIPPIDIELEKQALRLLEKYYQAGKIAGYSEVMKRMGEKDYLVVCQKHGEQLAVDKHCPKCPIFKFSDNITDNSPFTSKKIIQAAKDKYPE